MQSSKTPVSRPGTAIATAAERTRSAIEELQSRLVEVSHQGATAQAGMAPLVDTSETEDELERQLSAYFSGKEKEVAPDAHPARKRALEDLRQRVVDRVAERILEEWERSHPAAWNELREEVMERLVDRVLGQLQNAL